MREIERARGAGFVVCRSRLVIEVALEVATPFQSGLKDSKRDENHTFLPSAKGASSSRPFPLPPRSFLRHDLATHDATCSSSSFFCDHRCRPIRPYLKSAKARARVDCRWVLLMHQHQPRSV